MSTNNNLTSIFMNGNGRNGQSGGSGNIGRAPDGRSVADADDIIKRTAEKSTDKRMVERPKGTNVESIHSIRYFLDGLCEKQPRSVRQKTRLIDDDK